MALLRRLLLALAYLAGGAALLWLVLAAFAYSAHAVELVFRW